MQMLLRGSREASSLPSPVNFVSLGNCLPSSAFTAVHGPVVPIAERVRHWRGCSSVARGTDGHMLPWCICHQAEMYHGLHKNHYSYYYFKSPYFQYLYSEVETSHSVPTSSLHKRVQACVLPVTCSSMQQTARAVVHWKQIFCLKMP